MSDLTANAFILTEDQLKQVRQWERDRDALESEIAERQRKLSAINEKLKAVSMLGVQPPYADASKVHVNGKETETAPENKGANLTEAIERIAAESPTPLSKKQLKERLRAERFAEDRLGPYFYTVVMRLKKNGRVRVLDDGSVWRP